MGVLGFAVAAMLALGAFLAWRFTSVARGGQLRDDALAARLEPLAQRFENHETVTAGDIQILAESPELRPMLHMMLGHYQHLDLFPAQFLSEAAQAESALVYWMLHPNELQAAPVSLEVEAKLQRELKGKTGVFYVFRYKMPAGHWAGPEWQLGLAGPFFPDDQPYQGVAGGFSRAGDVSSKVTPEDLMNCYMDMLVRKGLA